MSALSDDDSGSDTAAARGAKWQAALSSLAMLQSNPDDICTDADGDQEILQDEIVWSHGHLIGYKVVKGKPYVLVPWYPTWESPDEYSKEEVGRVRRRWELQRPGSPRRPRGRPPRRAIRH
jgi:hypothetical protein